MKENFFDSMNSFWNVNFVEYVQKLHENPIRIVLLIIDLSIVIFLAYKLIKATRKMRVWQLVKGIAMLIILTLISGWIH